MAWVATVAERHRSVQRRGPAGDRAGAAADRGRQRVLDDGRGEHRRLRRHRPRPQHRRRPRRPARPRLRRLPRRRRLHRGDLSGAAASKFGVHLPFAVVMVIGAVVAGSSAPSSAPRPCGCAATTSPSSPSASARSSASPSTSTATPAPTHQRPQRHPEHPRPRALRLRLRRPDHASPGSTSAASSNYYLLIVLLARHSSCWSSAQPGLPHRPRLDRHPRGRDRRPRHGHQRLPPVKLIAFALGATLAGLAGTFSAHVTDTRRPRTSSFAGSRTPPSCSPRSSSAAWAP